MKTTITTLSTIAALLISGAAYSNTYINFNQNDSTSFSNDAGNRLTVKINATGNYGWKKYANFLGAGERWIWTTEGSQAVYLFDEERQQTQKMVDFSDPVGRNYNFTLGACTKSGMLAQKGLTLATAAGTFKNVVRMTFSGNCADAGIGEAWFAPKVGIVKWTSGSIIGPVAYSITNGRVGGLSFGSSTLQSAVKISASFPQSNIVLASGTEQVEANLELTNTSSQDLLLNFSSGQEFEITLLDNRQQIVNVWSADKRFTQALRQVALAAGESRSFGGALGLHNMNGLPLATGNYTLRIELKNASATIGETNLNTRFSAETSLSIRRRN